MYNTSKLTIGYYLVTLEWINIYSHIIAHVSQGLSVDRKYVKEKFGGIFSLEPCVTHVDKYVVWLFVSLTPEALNSLCVCALMFSKSQRDWTISTVDWIAIHWKEFYTLHYNEKF